MTNQIDKAPAGATHRYEHNSDVDWYCQSERGLYRWCHGSWCASTHKTIEDLADSCPLGRLEAIPAMRAEPAEDDLTWLVRESRGEWFGSHPTHIARDGDLLTWATFPRLPEGYHWFTKEQYLARRAELQNKPGWKDAPEWARSLAQHSVGRWTWYEEDPSPNDNGFWVDGGVCQCAGEAGEVLGDWRDTLERRPVSAGISGSEAAAGLKAFQVKAADAIDWSTAPEGATHHIGGDKLECPWHRVGGPLRYWNGKIWNKRSAFHTLDEAVAKGFAVVARPADLSSAAVIKRLDEATQNVLAAAPALMDEKYSFEPEFMPVSVSNETVQLERPIAVAGTGNGSAAESAFLIGRVIDLLRTSVDHFSADELADLNELTGAELTKRDAAVCGGQKYLDAHWFERGELPPVDARVMHMGTATDKDWLEVEIIAHAQRKGFKVAVFEYPGGVSFSSATYFRPIRTERDELIEVLKGTHAASLTNLDMLASAILSAGFKRGGV